VAEVATGVQFEKGKYRLDVAGGVAAPIGLGADPWPEFKVAATYTPAPALELTVTGARKGRVPTLRERFRLDIGNEALGPERATFGEVAVAISPVSWLQFDVAGYVRDTNGTIRFDGDLATLINTGDLVIRGVDTKLTVAPDGPVTGGVAWEFTDAYSAELGLDPLDHLATNRGTAWLQVGLGEGRGLRGQARYVGDRIDRNQILPSYTNYEVSGYARLRGDLFAAVRIDNLLDERHELRVGGVRAPGRVVVLSVRGSFNP
jgi:outer membrane cobalamin receptor